MQSKTTLPIIQKEESIPKSGDYDQLYKEGLERVSVYSGELWNNYNSGDPGVTILQTLCYALTELSYKTHLPIEDILTDERGDIVYQDRFVKPQEILPSPPVTLEDHKKAILDQVLELKQIYFNLPNASGLFNTFRPYLELKPNYAAYSEEESFTAPLLAKVDFLLQGQENLGQLFLNAQILNPKPISLSGKIYLQASVDVENFVAQLFFQLNDYLSPYPTFYSYDELLKQGKTNDEIFEGPLLRSGFLLDDNFEDKKTNLSAQSLMALINDLDGVDAVSGISFSGEQTLELPFNEAPYFDLNAFFSLDANLQLIQNGRAVSQISESKVQYQLKSILPRPQEVTDFDDYLPKGSSRKIKDYYSIQHHFPEIYKLDKLSYLKHADDVRSAKIKQLKAYLALFEQTMANYLAQLSQVGDLFSFDSGRTVYQLAGKTYYFQDLYDVPGIQEIFKDVNGYSKQYNERSSYEDWKAYQRDYLNPYRQQLMAAMESPNINLDRKVNVLKHLLARYGVEYDGHYLEHNNPGYGDSRTAEVDQISNTLKQFPLLSANRARTYFSVGEVAEPFVCEPIESLNEMPKETLGFPPYPYFSGLELLAGNELNINSFYEGIEEIFWQSLKEEGDTLVVLYYDGANTKQLFPLPKSTPTKTITNKEIGWIDIYQNKKLLLSFSYGEIDKTVLSLEEVEVYFSPYIETLSRLRAQCQGFVFIDHIQLFKGLYFRWEVSSKIDGAKLYSSEILTLEQFEETMNLIKSDLKLVISDSEGTFLTELDSNQDVAPIAESPDLKSAEELNQELHNFREGLPHTLSFSVQNENWDKITLPSYFLENDVSVLFPCWVASLQEKSYKAFLNRKLQNITPLNIHMGELQFIDQKEMAELLDLYSLWMLTLHNRKPRSTTDDTSSEAKTKAKPAKEVNWEILKKMNEQYERS